MQKIKILAVGGIKEQYLKDAIAEYKKRLSRFCSLEIVEASEKPKFPLAQKIDAESEELLAKAAGRILLFDRSGKDFSSEDLAALLKEWQKEPIITLIIGGSNGVNEKLKQSASRLVKFGNATFPHQLFRVMAIEQLYRAYSINAGSPYHK